MNQNAERLNKVLSTLGYGSRRSIDRMIEAKRIFVNGLPATLGQKVVLDDTITVNGKTVARQAAAKSLIALHKPRGVTTTKRDRYAKVTVMDFLLPRYQHFYPIGRLDRLSRGLLLLTNDGQLALTLSHPRYSHEKEYEVTVAPHEPTSQAHFNRDMTRLTHEIIDPTAQSRPIIVKQSFFDERKQAGSVTVILREGKNRQIRRLFSALGYTVTDLLRTRIGAITLDHLGEGEYREIDPTSLAL